MSLPSGESCLLVPRTFARRFASAGLFFTGGGSVATLFRQGGGILFHLPNSQAINSTFYIGPSEAGAARAKLDRGDFAFHDPTVNGSDRDLAMPSNVVLVRERVETASREAGGSADY